VGKYRIYEVSTARIKPGKGAAVVKWWHEKGKAVYEVSPGTKSVKAYAVQFRLGSQYQLEIWREIEDYGTYDRLDEDVLAHPENYAAFDEATNMLEFGPRRLMGDWPQSQFGVPDDKGD
jgi:hypothetical protein